MNIMFIGAAHEVTGSCTLINACGKRILIDCGMEQGADIFENCTLPVAPGEIDAIFLTHAHIDHSGKLPALAAAGYSGPIYCTEATKLLASLMLRDSAHIQEFEAEWRNRKAKRSGAEEYIPMYTVADVEKTAKLFSGHSYGEEISVCDGISCRFCDAGHLLGSASILFTITEDGVTRTVLFSGDLGNPGKPLICPPCTPPHADIAVIESTYGDRLHGPKPDYIAQLSEIIQSTLDRGGNVVIPSFAVGRTQELLYLIREIKARRLICGHDGFTVWIDSPLSVEATNIYTSEIGRYCNDETAGLIAAGINPISFDGLRVAVSSDDSKRINEDRSPKVIISASGMCEAGRIRHHLKHNLWRADSTILFVGYQTEGTLGAKLLSGAKSVKLFGEDISVNATVTKIDSFSSHADRDKLLAWLGEVGAQRVFVNHGEDSVCEGFAALVHETLNADATAPYSGDIFDIVTGECIERAPVKRVMTKKAEAAKRANKVFERLMMAGQRLLSVIAQYKGAPNKQIAALTDKINDLCDKYQR